MRLYYFPDACSLVINIALRAAKMRFELIEVDYVTRRLHDGSDFSRINPMAYVPALQLSDGRCLTEVIAIIDWIDLAAPEAGLLGAQGTHKRQEAMTWLALVGTEIHKSFSPLFRRDTPHEFLAPGQRHLKKRLSRTEQKLSEQHYLCADTPTAADYYLFVTSRWMGDSGLSARDWPAIQAHAARIESLGIVQDALASDLQ
ncbi:glutathione binding-like protein [Ruegeria sp. EL01]|uniref:glutathione binding-like protein n=1 Tax=Ruegeria sp. EL01 TaxID=2107578 RepID=UPI000EA7FD2E|nr:glutathione binding-like protein [Ruegeria sp. EL01]